MAREVGEVLRKNVPSFPPTNVQFGLFYCWYRLCGFGLLGEYRDDAVLNVVLIVYHLFMGMVSCCGAASSNTG